jgi:hypothetical protein
LFVGLNLKREYFQGESKVVGGIGHLDLMENGSALWESDAELDVAVTRFQRKAFNGHELAVHFLHNKRECCRTADFASAGIGEVDVVEKLIGEIPKAAFDPVINII